MSFISHDGIWIPYIKKITHAFMYSCIIRLIIENIKKSKIDQTMNA